tara:strand:+ start:502 stop:1044 length:543 start_codon:yes stop_codon:yes gene_type:complete
MKNNNFKINKLLLMVIFFLSCNLDKEIPSSDSIYNYSEEILGDPISIIISESEKIIYEIKSDKLLDSLGNIILIGGVAIEVFDDVGIKINDIYSNRAIVYSETDSMSAFGNVKIISSARGDQLFTDKIILYNTTQSVVSNEEVLFINDGDSLRGVGFWSDFEMENWKIERPIGSINKDKE